MPWNASRFQSAMRAGLPVRARLDNDELVAAEPRHRILSARLGAQPLGDELQELIAGLVPEGIFDRLEAIEIKTVEREARACSPSARKFTVQAFVKVKPVRQARQRFVSREMLELCLYVQEITAKQMIEFGWPPRSLAARPNGGRASRPRRLRTSDAPA